MSNRILTVSETRDLLDRLRAEVREFATREEKLNRDFILKKRATGREIEETAEQEQSRLDRSIDAAVAAFDARKADLEERYTARQQWISLRARGCRQQIIAEMEGATGQRKYSLQTQILQAGREKEQIIAATEKTYREFAEALTERHDHLVALERQARKSFRGFGNLLRMLAQPPQAAEPDLGADENHLLADLGELLRGAEDSLSAFRARPVPRLFSFFPVALLLLLVVLVHLGLAALVPRFELGLAGFVGIGASLLVITTAVKLSYRSGHKEAKPLAEHFSLVLDHGRKLYAACLEKAEARRDQALAVTGEEFERRITAMEHDLQVAGNEPAQPRAEIEQSLAQRERRIVERNDATFSARAQRLDEEAQAEIEALAAGGQESCKALLNPFEEARDQMESGYQANWTILASDWSRSLDPIYQSVTTATAAVARLFPDWSESFAQSWTPPEEFARFARFARLEIDVAGLSGKMPQDERLELPGPANLCLPLSLSFPDQGSLLIETDGHGREQAVATLNEIVLRLLSNSPPGRLKFTIFDPVGLGENFSGVMHLTEYEGSLINKRIWTQPRQIEEQLAELNEHMEKVIQMYLRNEYETIVEYNEKAGNIAEKYHFLVIADFPANFSDLAAKRLMSIAKSGAKCGVYTLIHWDRRQSAPQDLISEDLRESSICISNTGSGFALGGSALEGAQLVLAEAPGAEFTTDFIHRIGKSSLDSTRVEVPFSQITPPEQDRWSLDFSEELRVPIGRTGATKLQHLAIGKGTRQHALIAGKTGSGKSTLFHVMITNLALWSRPEEVEFYLVDFKKGVEFKCYATENLPHARVIAIESDREFGLSVLQRVDDELRQRGDMFRDLGVQDIPGYKRAGGTAPIPRTLLMIDEFQELFVEDDRIAQNASVLLDRIVRQGRAFGIHVILGSQTLGGAFTLARTTLSQMVIRIALQCSEADAYLIMDDSNPAPRLLSRPGEGIYNDSAGALEGNSPFQVVWLPDEVRNSYLAEVRELAERSPVDYPQPIVFEGNAPANVEENPELRRLLGATTLEPAGAGTSRAWLGAPNSIKGPTEVAFERQSGNNLLIAGQRDEAALAILAVSLISLAAQHPAGTARFIILDSSPQESPERAFLESLVNALGPDASLPLPGEIGREMGELASELRARGEDESGGGGERATFLIVRGLQRFKKLRFEEDFGFSEGDGDSAPDPGAILNDLICEGPAVGMHVIAIVDTYNNISRFLSRKAVSEFEMRVLFQMSANDSASLIDSPAAGNLGLHRALYYNEQQGYLETFRPYALPEKSWIEDATAKLKALRG